MINALAAALADWRDDDTVKAVAIRGSGDRAFCAGGDIRAVQQAVMAGTDEGTLLLRDEYHLNALIGAYPKPYIALLHGITMGGGAGVSVHGRYRLADAGLNFAMPETAIGFIPDVGSSYFPSRCPGEMGMYLALTGARIGLGDATDAGLVTHAVNRQDFETVLDGLARGDTPAAVIKPACGQGAAGRVGRTSPPHRNDILRKLSGSDPGAARPRWQRLFARETAQTIRTRSPTSLKLVYRQIRAAAHLDLEAVPGDGVPVGACVFWRNMISAKVCGRRWWTRIAAPKWQPSALAGCRGSGLFLCAAGRAGVVLIFVKKFTLCLP